MPKRVVALIIAGVGENLAQKHHALPAETGDGDLSSFFIILTVPEDFDRIVPHHFPLDPFHAGQASSPSSRTGREHFHKRKALAFDLVSEGLENRFLPFLTARIVHDTPFQMHRPGISEKISAI